VPIAESVPADTGEPADVASNTVQPATEGSAPQSSDREAKVRESQVAMETTPAAERSPRADAVVYPVEGHVFVSYKSEDRHRARMLAEALERRGWPVWWDRDIQAGQAFRRVIAQALSDAVCMVVLWTDLSVESDWVQEEAQEAKARGILIPAILDEVRPPLGFGQMHSASLVGWGGAADDPLLDGLLRSVATQIGLAEVPPLLGDEDWAAVVESERVMRGRAAAVRATEERAVEATAREEAERAASERLAAADAGEAKAEAEAARREETATAAADRATDAAEEREAEMAAELAAEYAAELRAVAARRAEKEAKAEAAEEAARRAQEEREAARTTGEREAKARAAEREASLQVAEEAAQAAEKTAEQVVAAKADPRRWAASGIGATEPAARASWFRFPREGVATLLGAVLVGISASLPWTQLDGGESALRYPLRFLLDSGEREGSDLGILLLAIAVIGGVLALFRVPRWITVILGAVVVTVALWFVVGWVATLDEDDTVTTFFQIVSFGPAVAIAGGLLMVSGR
jgi:hypothetical protein